MPCLAFIQGTISSGLCCSSPSLRGPFHQAVLCPPSFPSAKCYSALPRLHSGDHFIRLFFALPSCLASPSLRGPFHQAFAAKAHQRKGQKRQDKIAQEQQLKQASWTIPEAKTRQTGPLQKQKQTNQRTSKAKASKLNHCKREANWVTPKTEASKLGDAKSKMSRP